MSGFDPGWLDLREPADARARPAGLQRALAQLVSERRPARLVDLGTGTGANLRALAPWCGPQQAWLAVDHDQTLLAAFTRRMERWAVERGGEVQPGPAGMDVRVPELGLLQIEVGSADLVRDLDALRLVPGCLVTASALLDLVATDWLRRLVARCRAVDSIVYLALTFDGTVTLDPPLADDAWIVAALNQHQRSDKGFGLALGAAATDTARRLFDTVGFSTRVERSDWQLGPADAALQTRLFTGWCDAAAEMFPQQLERIAAWLSARRSALASGCASARVGHLDLLAW